MLGGCVARAASSPARRSIIARNWPYLRRRVAAQIDEHFIFVAPSPALRWIVALYYGMSSGPVMVGRMVVGRLVATADMTTGPAYAQVNPDAPGLQAFLATARARHDAPNCVQMQALTHNNVSGPE